MAKQKKRGPGRPRKDEVEPKRRGRKPGIKNKTFLEKVSLQADSLEKAAEALWGTLNDAMMADTNETTQGLVGHAEGLVKGISETLGDALGAIAKLPDGYAPTVAEAKELEWKEGAFVIFKSAHPFKKMYPDAYEVVAIHELGKGPGNGTMIQLDKGMFPKAQLELVDGDTLQEAVPTPAAVVKPKASAPRNGAAIAMPPAATLPTAEVDGDDLNA